MDLSLYDENMFHLSEKLGTELATTTSRNKIILTFTRPLKLQLLIRRERSDSIKRKLTCNQLIWGIRSYSSICNFSAFYMNTLNARNLGNQNRRIGRYPTWDFKRKSFFHYFSSVIYSGENWTIQMIFVRMLKNYQMLILKSYFLELKNSIKLKNISIPWFMYE